MVYVGYFCKKKSDGESYKKNKQKTFLGFCVVFSQVTGSYYKVWKTEVHFRMNCFKNQRVLIGSVFYFL